MRGPIILSESERSELRDTFRWLRSLNEFEHQVPVCIERGFDIVRNDHRQYESPHKGWSPPIDAIPRVVAAAIQAEDGEVLIGIRHFSSDMHCQIHNRVDGRKFKGAHLKQGFVDQWGRFLTRTQAFNIASANNQIIRPDAAREGEDGMELYSECLY